MNATRGQTRLACALVCYVLISTFSGCGADAPLSPPAESSDSPGASSSYSHRTAEESLPKEQRQRVWDIEHLAFMLEVELFPVWKTALMSESADSLQRFFAPACSAEVPVSGGEQIRRHGSVTITEWTDPQAVSAERFIDAVENLVARTDESLPRRISLGLVRLGPSEASARLNGPWKSVWKLQVAGGKDGRPVDVKARLALDFSSVAEGMHKRDAWITSASLHDVTEITVPQALMQEVTESAGFATELMRDNWKPECKDDFRTKTGGVYTCDYDLDGVLDVLVEDIEAGRLLYRGRGDGTFEDTTEQAGLALDDKDRKVGLLWTAAVWADLDGDADEDLVSEGHLYENLGNGTFADVTDKTNLRLTPAAGYAVADYDLDGRTDLYVCHTSKYLPGQTVTTSIPWIDGTLGIDNVLWKNAGNWQFQDVTAAANAGGSGTVCFAAVWLDANLDRYPDVLCINEFGRNAMLLNDGNGGFAEHDIDPVFGGFSMGVTAGDVNNDGRSDVYVANMYSKAGNRIISNVDPDSYQGNMYDKLVDATLGSRLYLSNSDGGLVAIEHQSGLSDVGWAYGPAFGDFDADGLADIYATVGFRSVQRGKPDG